MCFLPCALQKPPQPRRMKSTSLSCLPLCYIADSETVLLDHERLSVGGTGGADMSSGLVQMKSLACSVHHRGGDRYRSRTGSQGTITDLHKDLHMHVHFMAQKKHQYADGHRTRHASGRGCQPNKCRSAARHATQFRQFPLRLLNASCRYFCSFCSSVAADWSWS